MSGMKKTCPFGHDCKTDIIKDGEVIHLTRCRWYIKLKGKNPQSNEPIDNWGCAMSFLPILLIENAQTNRGQTRALESFRNEVIKEQKQLSRFAAYKITDKTKKN